MAVFSVIFAKDIHQSSMAPIPLTMILFIPFNLVVLAVKQQTDKNCNYIQPIVETSIEISDDTKAIEVAE